MNASRRSLGSDFSQIDLHEIGEAEYAELPEITDEDFARSTLNYGGKRTRGRPPSGSGTKQLLSLRLDPEIQTRFRSGGPGWQARMNTFLLHNETLLKMIVDFDDAIGEMENLIMQLRAGRVGPANGPVEAAILRLERTIRANKKTARTLRDTLVWEPTEAVG